MHIASLIIPERVVSGLAVTGKKHALEQLSQLLAQHTPDLAAEEVFDSLISREQLGSTGLGRGVAIPHGRMRGLRVPLGACVQLATPIDYDALDHTPVDLLFALLVPEESPDEHLQLLAQLAQMFCDAAFTQRLRASLTSQALYELIQRWEPIRASA